MSRAMKPSAQDDGEAKTRKQTRASTAGCGTCNFLFLTYTAHGSTWLAKTRQPVARCSQTLPKWISLHSNGICEVTDIQRVLTALTNLFSGAL
eukprot:1142302-Pelagomonas_calceolata.AAC.13